MNDEQLAAWLAQHGGEVGRKDNEQDVDDPSDTGPKLQGEKKRQIKTIDSTTITAKDGATVTLRRLPGPAGSGDIPAYQVTEQTPPKPVSGTRTPEQQTVDAAAASKAAQDQKEREKNAAWPQDQDPRYETDAEREARGIRTRQEQATAANTAADNRRADEASAATRAAQNRPGAPTLSPDGKGGTIAVQTMPDGSIKTTPLPNVPTEAKSITVDGRIYERQQDGTYKDVTPVSRTSMPAGVTPPDFSGGKSVSAEMARFISELDAAKKNGLITNQEALDLAKPYHDLGTTALTEQTQTLNQQNTQTNQQLTQRSQDITQRSDRSKMAQGLLNTAIEASQALSKGGDPKNFKPTLIPLLALQGAVQFALGAMKPVSDVQTPAIAQRVTAPAAPPNALGLGSTGSIVTPGAAPVVPAPAAPAVAEAERQQQAAASVAPAAVSTSPALAPAGAPSRVVDSQPGAPMMPPAVPTTQPPLTVPPNTYVVPPGTDVVPPEWQYDPVTNPGAPEPGMTPASPTVTPDNGYGPAPSMLPPNEVTMAPSTGNALADRVDSGAPPTIEARAKQLIDGGANPFDVYFAMHRFLKKQGIDMFGQPGSTAA